MKSLYFFFSIIIFSWSGLAHAQSIPDFENGMLNANLGNGKGVIIFRGEITRPLAESFVEEVRHYSDALISLSGPGGNASAAILIGDTIRRNGYSTIVPAGEYCASACALAWLGGYNRFQAVDAMVGFHSVYYLDRGDARISAVGNARVGAYLQRLGLGDEALQFIVSTPPEEIHWLSRFESEYLGISSIVVGSVFDPAISRILEELFFP